MIFECLISTVLNEINEQQQDVLAGPKELDQFRFWYWVIGSTVFVRTRVGRH